MRPPADDVRTFLARIAPYVERDGARNLNEISRDLDIPYQTLRTRMAGLSTEGIEINPVINPARLGLKRYRVGFKLAPDFASVKSIFGGLHQSAGLVYYARSFFSQRFDTEFWVPSGKESQLRKMLNGLEELKFLGEIKIRELVFKHIPMMQARFYDYENRSWDIDFSTLRGNPSIAFREEPFEQPKFDHTDLMIIKSLQLDPFTKLVDIARLVHLTPESIAYHLNKHVFDLRQLNGFTMKWNGPREAWSKHSILHITLVFDSISEEKTKHVISVLSMVPFTWSHIKAKDGTYLAELIVPTAFISETMKHISDKLRALDVVPIVDQVDWSCVSSYTIPYMMHSEEMGWKFNVEESLGYVLEMIKTYKQ